MINYINLLNMEETAMQIENDNKRVQITCSFEITEVIRNKTYEIIKGHRIEKYDEKIINFTESFFSVQQLKKSPEFIKFGKVRFGDVLKITFQTIRISDMSSMSDININRDLMYFFQEKAEFCTGHGRVDSGKLKLQNFDETHAFYRIPNCIFDIDVELNDIETKKIALLLEKNYAQVIKVLSVEVIPNPE